jgi:hypothetical protein
MESEQFQSASLDFCMSRSEPFMTALDPGKWYLVVECRRRQCGRAIVIREAPDDPTEQISIEEQLRLQCPHCMHEGVYTPFDVRRIQATERP